MDTVTYLEDVANATFIKVSAGKQIWELESMQAAETALLDLFNNAVAWNWCPVQQPNGAPGKRPQIQVTA